MSWSFITLSLFAKASVSRRLSCALSRSLLGENLYHPQSRRGVLRALFTPYLSCSPGCKPSFSVNFHSPTRNFPKKRKPFPKEGSTFSITPLEKSKENCCMSTSVLQVRARRSLRASNEHFSPLQSGISLQKKS